MLSLSRRETEVCGYIVRGFTTKETARRIGISYRTVEQHRLSIFAKLRVNNAVRLTRLVYGIKDEEP